ncbi:MAG: hypothetical protein WC824_06005 [Bacteroidota bacterium]|jgi:hypothetical protein
MNNHPGQLFFPHIVRIPDQFARLSPSDPDNKAIPLYRLDWEIVDVAKERKHFKWLSQKDNKARGIPFQALTSPEWETQIDGLSFALTREYREHIYHCTNLAQTEWCLPRPFDTNIRDKCLRIATEAVQVSFYLLLDCLWDSNIQAPNRLGKGYWVRGELREVFRSACLIRFWDHQIGRAKIQFISGLDDLQKYARDQGAHLRNEPNKSEIEKIKELVLSFETRMALYNKSVESLTNWDYGETWDGEESKIEVKKVSTVGDYRKKAYPTPPYVADKRPAYAELKFTRPVSPTTTQLIIRDGKEGIVAHKNRWGTTTEITVDVNNICPKTETNWFSSEGTVNIDDENTISQMLGKSPEDWAKEGGADSVEESETQIDPAIPEVSFQMPIKIEEEVGNFEPTVLKPQRSVPPAKTRILVRDGMKLGDPRSKNILLDDTDFNCTRIIPSDAEEAGEPSQSELKSEETRSQRLSEMNSVDIDWGSVEPWTQENPVTRPEDLPDGPYIPGFGPSKIGAWGAGLAQSAREYQARQDKVWVPHSEESILKAEENRAQRLAKIDQTAMEELLFQKPDPEDADDFVKRSFEKTSGKTQT